MLIASAAGLSAAGCGISLPSLGELLPVLLAAGQLNVRADINRPYVTVAGRTLTMDMFAPRESVSPTPAVVLIHGGFWLAGSRTDLQDWAADLANHGCLAATIDYRLLPDGGVYPAPVADVLAAIRYLRDHAGELNIDSQRIAVFGVSAGAHLALLAGLAEDASIFDPAWPSNTSAGVRAVVEIYGPTDFTADPAGAQPWQLLLIAWLLGGPGAAAPQRLAEASPINHVRADGPPVFMLHGTADPIVPIEQARAMRDALMNAGEAYEYFEIPDAGHFWGSYWWSEPAQRHRDDILRFLAEHLGP